MTLLASGHAVRGYRKGYDGKEQVSSTSGDAFMTDLFILQRGDRISLRYFTTRRSARFERTERAEETSADVIPPPLITKLPFALQPDFNSMSGS